VFKVKSTSEKWGSHREVFNPNGLRQSVANVKTNRATLLNGGVALVFIVILTQVSVLQSFL